MNMRLDSSSGTSLELLAGARGLNSQQKALQSMSSIPLAQPGSLDRDLPIKTKQIYHAKPHPQHTRALLVKIKWQTLQNEAKNPPH
jgi:hypothetical protein